MVTEINKGRYLRLLCEHRLRGVVRQQLEAMLRGLRVLVPEEVLCQIRRMVSEVEFGLLLCGYEELDVKDWKAQSVRDEGTLLETWKLFWKVVEAMNAQQRSELLEFVTGSSTLPVGGFAALPGYGGRVERFTVAPLSASRSNARHLGLPTAATCFNKLLLPAYSREAEMRAALLEAVSHRGTGFNEAAAAQ
eukprot:gnl/TRDRNA2_/TRDRNA2_142287_c1_seq1.p1 gnl/TRDRNA2_/TRDRNA2_142287_c1~~gnl/TRDRNA2_/TRDRNA2_142287_c1_seq1.p1  ORF type:complete len:219 (+),score=39.61 gnl/TRDRNA2_/TRDRNA2_142287_c1_seq1:83-658(+)